MLLLINTGTYSTAQDLKEQNNILQSQMSTIDFNMYEEFENIKQENSSLRKKYDNIKHKYLSLPKIKNTEFKQNN